MSETKIFAVAGAPVLHSRSPEMFNEAFRGLPIDAVYTRLAGSKPEDVVRIAREVGMSGFNVTLPFKEGILPLLDGVDEDARAIGAVNTVIVREGRFFGYNTDSFGVTAALTAKGVTIKGGKAVVVGAGGAARAVVFGLCAQGADVVVVNRTFEKAQGLADAAGCGASSFEGLDQEVADARVLIVCVPFSGRIVNSRALRKGLVVLDGNYGIGASLAEKAKRKGCHVIDGREWLLFQGARALTLFTGMDAPVEVMRKALYKKRVARKGNIALIGFMGTGKSTIAGALSKKMGMPLVDIDQAVEEKTGYTISEIFRDEGERVFRNMESREIGHIGNMPHQAIISCGGGAVLSERNREILRRYCTVVWLWAREETILERIGDGDARPLLCGEAARTDVRRMMETRLPLYAGTADVCIGTDGEDPETLAEKIYNEVSRVHRYDGGEGR